MDSRWMLLSTLVLSACSACPKAPHDTVDTPARLVENFKFHLDSNCSDESYKLLSERSHKEFGEWKWYVASRRATIRDLKLGDSDLKLREVILSSTILDPDFTALPGEDEKNVKERFWLFEDHLNDEDERCRTFNLLLRKERVDSKQVWRLALGDQVARNIKICAEEE